MANVRGQVPTTETSEESIMRKPSFMRGVKEYRAGKLPNFDTYITIDCAWDYERGRQWAAIAPRDLKVFTTPGKLNPKALILFKCDGFI
jgi:hypothetical protein